MLLSEILKNTWESHPDYEPLSKALQDISDTAVSIEAAQEKQYNINKIISIQNDLRSKKDRIKLLEPGREYLTEQLVSLKLSTNPDSEPHKRKLILFSDLLLIAKVLTEKDPEDRKKKKEVLKLHKLIYLNDIQSLNTSTCETELLMHVEDVDYTLIFADAQKASQFHDKLRATQVSHTMKRSSLHKTTGSLKPERRGSTKKAKTPKSAQTLGGSAEVITYQNPLLQIKTRQTTKKRSTTSSGTPKTPAEALIADSVKRSPSMDCLHDDSDSWSAGASPDDGESVLLTPAIAITESERPSDCSDVPDPDRISRKRAFNRSPSVDCLQKITPNAQRIKKPIPKML